MRLGRTIASTFASIIGVLLLSAQAQRPDAHFEASSTLVQVDAVVRANGHAVPDLTAADFQIYEDGKPQVIAAATLQPNRTTAFLVDACDNYVIEREDGKSVAFTRSVIFGGIDSGQPRLWGVPYLRTERAVARFLGSEIIARRSPDDRLAILADHEGSGRLAEPSNDADRLNAGLAEIPLPGRLTQGCPQFRDAELSILDALRSRLWLEGGRLNIGHDFNAPYSAISDAIDSLADIPGHKDLLVFGLLGVPKDESFQELTTRANRLGISLNIMQLGGAIDRPIAVNPEIDPKNWDAYRKFLAADARIRGFTAATGGVYSRLPDPHAGKSNQEIVLGIATGIGTYDFFGVLRRYEQDFVNSVLDSSVYLISYKPSAASGAYHKIDLKILRPGVTARWRAGYFDTPVEQTRIALPAPEELALALERPLRGTAIGLRVMPFDRADEGPKGLRTIVDLVLSMDAHDLTWTQQADGSRKARIDATAAWYTDDSPQPEGTVTHSCDLTQTTPSDTAQCAVEIDPDKATMYFVRAAVRDAASGKLGTAYTMAPAPGYNSGHIMLSAPVVRGASRGALSVDPVLTPGEVVDWQMTVYAATPDKKTNKPNLTLRINIGNEVTFKPVTIGDEEPVSSQGPAWRIPLNGKVQLPTDLVPGDYIIEFLVTDKLGRDKRVGAVQQNSRVAEFHIKAGSLLTTP